jgi:hypothetical protein
LYRQKACTLFRLRNKRQLLCMPRPKHNEAFSLEMIPLMKETEMGREAMSVNDIGLPR